MSSASSQGPCSQPRAANLRWSTYVLKANDERREENCAAADPLRSHDPRQGGSRKGERFILLKGGKPVAELRPAKGPARLHLKDLPEVLVALPHLGSDDAERFARDLE